LFPDLLADENVDFRIVRFLRDSGFKVFSVVESCPGVSDKEIIALAKEKRALLIMEDHDFGEWVFAHHEPTLGVVFLRYRHSDYQKIALEGSFQVLIVHKILISHSSGTLHKVGTFIKDILKEVDNPAFLKKITSLRIS